MKIMAVDPGKTGSAVMLDSDYQEAIYHNFKFDKNNVFCHKPFHAMIMQLEPDIIIMEKVHGRGGMGANSVFTFGFATGQILTVIKFTEIPFKHITPQSWQKVAHEGIGSKLTAKERSMAAFHNLNPHRPLGDSPKHDIVDAFLIAHTHLTTFHRWIFKEFQF